MLHPLADWCSSYTGEKISNRKKAKAMITSYNKCVYDDSFFNFPDTCDHPYYLMSLSVSFSPWSDGTPPGLFLTIDDNLNLYFFVLSSPAWGFCPRTTITYRFEKTNSILTYLGHIIYKGGRECRRIYRTEGGVRRNYEIY